MKRFLILGTFIVLLAMLAIPMQAVQADNPVVYVYNLQPAWDAPGGGGVWAAYYAPDSDTSSGVSPGTTAVYDGRTAGIIKAGLTAELDGSYMDEGLLGFKLEVAIDNFATMPLTYAVENQYGTNPVWMRIEVDTGVVGVRTDDTFYQFIPTTNPAGWHTVDAAAGQWQAMDNDGNGVGSLMTLSQVATANTGRNVLRVYLTLGMGDSYHGTGQGTVAWIDTATIGGTTYDFAVNTGTTTATGDIVGPTIVITAPTLPAFGNFLPGANKVASSTDGTVTVTPGSDGNTAWTVTAKDVAGGGYMWLGGTISGTRLANKFQISPDNWATWAYADAGITYSGSSATGTLPLYAQQVMASTDTTPGTYSITITFTGTCTP